MATKGLLTALTLYRCGTLTFAQAATRAGQNAEAFARTLKQHGIPRRSDAVSPTATAAPAESEFVDTEQPI
ncbi:hypothetical protein EGH24_06715 [Halonotius terrestris]|uniref:Uncharacterized protein n=1 Tax=Halonotius terrestris TaxID=2487750 RepID=A0A8J8PB95_9EURY|nr:UPF0175 family protein [Halonotius terrestris]TQQ80847.1 hypothetical protein EGH24_06715 [Halonotius terrestris]